MFNAFESTCGDTLCDIEYEPGYYAAVGQGLLGSGSIDPETADLISKVIDRRMEATFESIEMDGTTAKSFADAAQITGSENTQATVKQWMGQHGITP
jgi:hypothetical protein